jgi:imidazolonepropionase-like amidohydrolase
MAPASPAPGWVLSPATAEGALVQDRGGPVTVFASRVLDGRGGNLKNATVVIDQGRILRVEPRKVERPTFDFTGGTVLPGLIDLHVHLTAYVTRRNRVHTDGDGETPAQAAYAAAANAHRTLLAGFTTVASIGSADDRDLRDAIASGEIPGPRVLTTLAPIADASLSEDQLRREVTARAEAGADLIKLFASKSIREGGEQTMSEGKLRAACDEARRRHLPAIVHAHSVSSIEAAVRAGCPLISHGVFATKETLELMARQGTYFDPQCALVFRNYLDNRARFQGIGNFTAEGFASMERAIPLAVGVTRTAATIPNLKIGYGTDAVAGAHGRNAVDLECRVRQAGHRPMDAIVAATSRNAEALGLAREVGLIGAGMTADLIAVAGNPLEDIGALGRVVLVMRSGRVFRHDPTLADPAR